MPFALLPWAQMLMLSMTACAFSGSPSEKVMPGLMWRMNFLAESWVCQLLSSHGLTLPVAET